MSTAPRRLLPLLLAACQQRPAVPQGAAAPAAPRAEATIRIAESPDGPEARRFGVFDVSDLYLSVRWHGAAGDAPFDRILEVYAPDGTLYRQERAPAGSPLRCTLAVAGTNISRHAITGIWSAEVRWEGGGTAVAVAEFELTAQLAGE